MNESITEIWINKMSWTPESGVKWRAVNVWTSNMTPRDKCLLDVIKFQHQTGAGTYCTQHTACNSIRCFQLLKTRRRSDISGTLHVRQTTEEEERWWNLCSKTEEHAWPAYREVISCLKIIALTEPSRYTPTWTQDSHDRKGRRCNFPYRRRRSMPSVMCKLFVVYVFVLRWSAPPDGVEGSVNAVILRRWWKK